MIVFFFFQAEDGIRDLYVTGVQTCALPIYEAEGGQRIGGERKPCDPRAVRADWNWSAVDGEGRRAARGAPHGAEQERRVVRRSEERRVGEECRSRWGRYD